MTPLAEELEACWHGDEGDELDQAAEAYARVKALLPRVKALEAALARGPELATRLRSARDWSYHGLFGEWAYFKAKAIEEVASELEVGTDRSVESALGDDRNEGK
ncbi:MAG: hypothetical protein JRN62_03235 [Nitrososphaerota archaeon]|jgi:hypothetical protein|nr:hypothetical protein [Nitrososphaerota archaeon]MDG6948611.1 hypothetical protein [Nitrososphaerota archaeon]